MSQIADQLAISDKTVRRWIDAGELRAHRLGRQIRVTEDDLATCVGARRR